MTQHPPHPQQYIITSKDREYALSHPNDTHTIYEMLSNLKPVIPEKITEDNWDPAIHGYCCSHTTPASQQRIEQVLNTLIARFMIANEKGQGRPWNIHHIVSLIETFRDTEAIAHLREGDKS